MTVLDVGGGTGDKTKRLRSLYNGPSRTSLNTWHSFECIQPGTSRKTDTCTGFDGRHIPREDESIDIVFYSYVLHHAGGNTIALLQETRRIARRYIVILEDLQYDTTYAARTEGTHPGCTGAMPCSFRGDREWRALFEILQLGKLVHNVSVDRHCARPAPRALYVLEKQPQQQQHHQQHRQQQQGTSGYRTSGEARKHGDGDRPERD